MYSKHKAQDFVDPSIYGSLKYIQIRKTPPFLEQSKQRTETQEAA